MDLGQGRPALPRAQATQVILLDTNALIWAHKNHRRTRPLLATALRLYASPASLLEIQVLVEGGRVHLRAGSTPAAVVHDDRWLFDDPPSAEWFERAIGESWTRDPFDRLLVAHARLRGWRFATGDGGVLERLSAAERFEL